MGESYGEWFTFIVCDDLPHGGEAVAMCLGPTSVIRPYAISDGTYGMSINGVRVRGDFQKLMEWLDATPILPAAED